MQKIKRLHIENHPVLGNLDLDFCRPDGCAVDTVIIAGENGVGKSSIMELLYGLISGNASNPFGNVSIEFESDGQSTIFSYGSERTPHSLLAYATNETTKKKEWIGSEYFRAENPMEAIYSDVDINFSSDNLRSVTSLTLDSESASRRSTEDLPTRINQLLIDVQALDAAEITHAVKNDPLRSYAELRVEERMPRFTRAFEMMFDDLRYDRIDNRDGHKEIVFRKCGREVPINALSSGEKQVVYRGCFLLKDVNATKGAFVFIDEPEISLHPTWQKKIMEYYKAVFTDSAGQQTSQIFCVTHSPFIIHSEKRHDDKVIVLKRDADGRIEVSDKPEYYRCDSSAAVEDAFSVRNLVREVPTVFLEGPTDEKYYRRAAQVFGVAGKIDFRWIGHYEDGDPGKSKLTGSSALRNAYEFFSVHKPSQPMAFLLDCDEKQADFIAGNVWLVRMGPCESGVGIKKGIENALVLDGMDLNEFAIKHESDGGYGFVNEFKDLDKNRLCEHVCSMGDEELRVVFANLETMIGRLEAFFDSAG